MKFKYLNLKMTLRQAQNSNKQSHHKQYQTFKANQNQNNFRNKTTISESTISKQQDNKIHMFEIQIFTYSNIFNDKRKTF